MGIAYLLTSAEYERLLQSEGGRDGGYKELDIEVVALEDLTAEVIMCKSLGTRTPRENPNPMPSARYVLLLRTGAAEHKFPEYYQTYLDDLPFYSISSLKTEIGRILFLMLWLPVILFVFAMMMRKGKLGQVPGWVKRLQIWAFTNMWRMHDNFFSPVFGPGDVVPEKKESRSSWSCEKC
jgi:hypothetical protein